MSLGLAPQLQQELVSLHLALSGSQRVAETSFLPPSVAKRQPLGVCAVRGCMRVCVRVCVCVCVSLPALD